MGQRPPGTGSLRVRLILLLAACLAPIAAFSIYESFRSYAEQRDRAREILLQTAQLAVDEEESLFASTERVLKALAAQPAIIARQEPACATELQRAFRAFPEYSQAVVLTADGRLQCTEAIGPLPLVQVDEVGWFEELRTGRPFVLSDPTIGRLSEVPVLLAAVPIRDRGTFIGALAVGIRLSWFDRWTRYYGLPPEAKVVLIDRDGVPLTARGGDGASAPPPPQSIRPHLSTQPALFEAEIGDGNPHVYALAPIYRDRIYALFGLPESGLLGSVRLDLATRLAGPIAMWLVALVASWFAVDRFVLRWIGQLRRTARAYAFGRYDVRAGVDRAPEELRELGETFEAMATLIRSRTRDLESSLGDKETLIKEIHHRVKNNLQTITSLLSLQSRRLPEGRDRRVLREAQARINALATVHRSIYETESLDSVVLSEFLTTLAQQVRDIAGTSADQLTVTVDAPARSIAQDRAVPVALLVNEAMTNAIKHGFADGGPGRIQISVRPRDDGGWRLEVADDGRPPPDDASPAGDSAGIGRSLMTAFAEQLGGTLDVVQDGGTTVRLDFPEL
jgi:two-component sensor histidine kinase